MIVSIGSARFGSHSVWSAWIEISPMISRMYGSPVALRLECVDRNCLSALTRQDKHGRTPFGVRG